MSFPTEESHYGRKRSSRLYLSPDLNLNRMHNAFKLKYPESKVQYKFYQRVFRKDFPNLFFCKPKTDTCNVCDKMNAQIKSSTPSTKTVLTNQLNLHQRKAEKTLALLSQDMNESQLPLSDTCSVSVDLQQVLFTPTLTHSSMFYSRQLSNYNFCVHVGDSGESYMCMWHEGLAGRGGNEIASCFLKVMTSGFTAKKKLTIWCDNCAGQNKNRMILMALIYLVTKGIFDEIDMKFLVSGHSYMPCDRDFGVIEKRRKVCRAMVPEELMEVVRLARRKKPFQVIEMKSDDFLDLAAAADQFLNTAKLQISKVSWIRVSSAGPSLIQTRNTFSDIDEWSSFQILRKGKNLHHIVDLQKFTTLIPTHKIKGEKKKDLLGMVKFMDTKYHEFYKNLCQ